MKQDLEESSPSPPTAVGGANRFSLRYLVITVVLVALVGGAYWLKTRPSPAEITSASQETLMKEGLDTLYTKMDPAAAAAQFRRVLALNPTHYGATYQLATALDRAGKSAEALPYWQKMLPMAEAVKDDATAATARARLQEASSESSSEAAVKALMTAGLDALYGQKDPRAAAIEFRKVLDRNPTHYGATYQLATALDQAGNPAEARPLWEKVLKMAERYQDQATVTAARTRLAKSP